MKEILLEGSIDVDRIMVGDVGKIIRVKAGIDLSKAVELKLTFTSPTGKVKPILAKFSKLCAPAVDHDGLKAHHYWEYPVQEGLFDEPGKWRVQGEYIDDTPIHWKGKTVLFTVEA